MGVQREVKQRKRRKKNSQQPRKKSASETVGSRQIICMYRFFLLVGWDFYPEWKKNEKISIHANPVALYSLWLNSRWNKNQQHTEHWMTCLIRECVCLLILFRWFVFYFAFFIAHLVFHFISISLLFPIVLLLPYFVSFFACVCVCQVHMPHLAFANEAINFK